MSHELRLTCHPASGLTRKRGAGIGSSLWSRLRVCAKDTGQRDTQPHTRKTQPPSPGGGRLTAPRAGPLNPPVSRRGWGDEGELQTGPSDSDAPGCGDGCPSLRMKDGPRLALGMGVCVVRGLCLSKTYCQKMLERHVEHHVALTRLLIWPRAEIWKPKREIRAPVWSGTLRDTQVLNWRLGGSLAGGDSPALCRDVLRSVRE